MSRTLLVVPALALATPALAFGPGFGPGPDGHHSPEERAERLDKALGEVGATEEQKSTIRTFFEETAPTLKALHDEGRQLREEMQEVFLNSPVIDRAEVELLRVDAVDLFDRASSTMLDLFVDVANVLTVEQRTQLHELKEAHHGRMHDRMERFREHRGERGE